MSVPVPKGVSREKATPDMGAVPASIETSPSLNPSIEIGAVMEWMKCSISSSIWRTDVEIRLFELFELSGRECVALVEKDHECTRLRCRL